MSWTAPSGHVWTTGEIVSAANMNTYIKDNLIDLDRRTTITQASVATNQTTTSVTYADLATPGPAVTVTVGATGQTMTAVCCLMSNSVTPGACYMGYAVSGATTIAATNAEAMALTSAINNAGGRFDVNSLTSGMVAGSNTFTAKYQVTANTGAFSARTIIVTPLGS